MGVDSVGNREDRCQRKVRRRGVAMRKLMMAGSVVLTHLLVAAGTALAGGGGGSALPSPDGGDKVGGVVVRAPGGVAFTGADIGMWLLAVGALLVIGGVLFVAGRRRTGAAS
jgi:LPXTG-motif cell wall-anchored protein